MAVKKTKPKKKTLRAAKKTDKKAVEKPAKKTGRYFEAVGRRKTSVARVRLYEQGQKEFLINDKSLEKYFSFSTLQQIVKESLEKMNCLDRFRILVRVRGGGLHSQAEAVRHGISRALIKFNAELRSRLKKAGFLTRDPRARERKKPGLKRARRAPQWKKR